MSEELVLAADGLRRQDEIGIERALPIRHGVGRKVNEGVLGRVGVEKGLRSGLRFEQPTALGTVETVDLLEFDGAKRLEQWIGLDGVSDKQERGRIEGALERGTQQSE